MVISDSLLFNKEKLIKKQNALKSNKKFYKDHQIDNREIGNEC